MTRSPGTVLVNLIHLRPGMAGVLRLSAGLLRALLRRPDAPRIRVVTTRHGLDALADFGVDLSPSMVTLVPDTIGRSKALAALSNLALVPWIARRHDRATVLSLDYYFSPAPGRARSISMVTDVQFLDRPANFSRGGRWSRAFFLRLGARFGDVVLGISHTSAARFVEAFPDAADKTVVVHMGIDTPTEPPNGNRGNAALFVGTTNNHKNLAVVIAALRAGLLSNFELIVAGRPGSYEATLREAMEDPSVGSSIRRLGRVSDPDLADLYGDARMLIAPSLYEGFDIPTIEAMANGVDVVASDLPVHREVLGDHAEYFDPEDPRSLAAAVHAARTRTDTQRSAATEHARSFTWDRSAEQLAAVL